MTALLEVMVTFALLTWGLAFLLADAKIFGCSTQHYVGSLTAGDSAEACHVLTQEGTLKIRNKLLRLKFFRDLLSCYFCLGIWCGPVAHIALRYGTPSHQWVLHTSEQQGWILGLLLSSVLGGAACYVVNLLVGALERIQP